MKTIYLLVCPLIFLISCGGGGSNGSPKSFYGGIWQFTGTKVIDDCNGPNSPIPNTFTTTVTINQNGENVVVDSENGATTYVGTTNDKDGFSAEQNSSGVGATSGLICTNSTAYVFEDASDGEANAAYVIVTICGSKQCTVAFKGTATRIS